MLFITPALSSSIPSSQIAGLHDTYRENNKKDTSQEQANFTNRSSPLLNMYVKMTEEEENKMTDRW
jgi:hypothetical protein